MSTPITSSRTRVLVIEDESALLDFFIMDLKAAGFETGSARDGIQASALLAMEPFDAVISDMMLPGKSGIEVLQELRLNKNITQPAYLMISGAVDILLEDMFHLGVHRFIEKPFSRHLLIDEIRRITKPIEESWSTPIPHAQWKGELTLKFDDVSSAEKQHLFSLGQRGFFISLENTPQESWPALSDILTFDISFDVGDPIRGHGIVRWLRTKATTTGPAGAGIEIVYLNPNSMTTFSNYIDQNKPIPVIPKS